MTTSDNVGGPRHAGRRGPVLVAAVVAVIGIVLSVVLASAVLASARADARQSFERSADQTAVAVERQVAGYFDNLRDVGSFVANAPDPTNADFKDYLAGARTFEQLPSLVMVFFLQRVDEADIDAFVERARAADPGFAYLELGPHQPGTPRYILSYFAGGNTDLVFPLGADASGIASVSNLVNPAGRIGSGVVGSFQADPFLQETAKQTNFPLIQRLLDLDFFIGLPVYAAGAPTTGERQPTGWIAGAVDDTDAVLTAAAKGLSGTQGVSLTVDLNDAGLGDRQDLSRVAQREGDAGPRDTAALTSDRSFQVDGVTLRLSVWSAPDALKPPATVWIVLFGGIVASLFAAGVFYLRLRQRQRERAFARDMADSAQFQRDVLDSVTNAMVVLDGDGRVAAANPAWAMLRGASDGTDAAAEADVGASYLDLLFPRVRAGSEQLEADLPRAFGGADIVEVDVAVDTTRGRRWYEVRATPMRGARGGAVVVHTDITERKRSHDELELKASHDDLTGLLNRQAFEAEVESDLLRARADESAVAVLFIDLDGFKPINDRYGHRVGDDVLRTVAQRITGAVRTTDRAARLGGDEFVVLVAPLADPGVAERTAERLVRALAEPINVQDHTVNVAASIGVAVADAPLGASASELVERADRAMYRAKFSGGASFTMAP